MAEQNFNARVKQTLQSSNQNAKTLHKEVSREKDLLLDICKDTIVDQKLEVRGTKLRILQEMQDENEVDTILNLEADEVLEKKTLAEEYESIVRKQLQLLQADERGKQALQNEIAEMKRRQQERSAILKSREKALRVERERAKRVAARPPPLPKSVRMLLKENEKKEAESAAGNERDESVRQPEIVEAEVMDSEDKENMDEEYHEMRRKMQQVWDAKAKKRFNEALRRDRQKQEHTDILKQIENAEKHNRRQMAKSISDRGGKVPCIFSDTLRHSERQMAMEDAVEKVYSKSSNTKEHAIEDLDGYEDKWEAKYKQIDSKQESKMIDCVPSFVKENYSYLLQEETTHQVGKRFSGFDDSTDELNMAYIESPPATGDMNSNEELAAVISHLDQMRTELNEAYEKEFKPLLVANDLPKVESFDKAVEAHILKLPTEDKAVGNVEALERGIFSSSSQTEQVDFMKGGLMAYKRRDIGSKLKMDRNAIGYHHPGPSSKEGERPNEGSWSSSSYWSLPSRHGLPEVCKFCDSPSCTTPLVEDRDLHKDCIPMSKSSDNRTSETDQKPLHTKDSNLDSKATLGNDLKSGVSRSKFSSFVKLVADKYLKNASVPVEPLKLDEKVTSKLSSRNSGVLQKSADDDRSASRDGLTATSQNITLSPVHKARSDTVIETGSKTKFQEVSKLPELQLNLVKSPQYSSKKSLIINIDDSDDDDVFIDKCRKILSENFSNVFTSSDSSVVTAEVCPPAASSESEEKQSESYVYHELSTIQEVDSALTNDTGRSLPNEDKIPSLGKSQPSSEQTSDDEDLHASSGDIDTTSMSLVDAPSSEATDLAKSIHFVRKPSPEPAAQQSEAPETPLSLISGTLTSIQTPGSVDDQGTSFTSDEPKALDGPTPTRSIDNQVTVPKMLDGPKLTSKNHLTSLGVESGFLSTPSSRSGISSPMSITSQGAPYASSFRDPNVKPPTSAANLPMYFRDVSSIKPDSSSASPSASSQVSATSYHKWGMQAVDNSDLNSFKPMTPRSWKSSPGSTHGGFETPIDKETQQQRRTQLKEQKRPLQSYEMQYSPDSGTFQPMTPRSYVPSLSQTSLEHQFMGNERNPPGRGGNSVQHLHTTASGQPLRGVDGSSLNSFQPMTPRLYVPSPSQTDAIGIRANPPGSGGNFLQYLQTRDVGQQFQGLDGSSVYSFQPMTPRSHSDFNSRDGYGVSKAASGFAQQPTQEGFSWDESIEKRVGNTETMTSNILLSSPSGIELNHSSHLREANHPHRTAAVDLRLRVLNRLTSDQDLQPIMPHSNVGPVKSYGHHNPSSDAQSTSSVIKFDDKSRNYRGAYNNYGNYNVGDGSHMLGEGALKSLPRQVSSKNLSNSAVTEKLIPQLKGDSSKLSPSKLRAAKVCSSGFFVPKFTPADFAHFYFENPPSGKELAAASKILPENKNEHSGKIDVLPPNEHVDASSVGQKGASVHSNDGTPKVGRGGLANPGVFSSLIGSPNPIIEALKQNFLSSRASPYGTPSNFSDVFLETSKVSHEATPVKSIEELCQETGILDEPDLTLFNSEYTIRPDANEKSKTCFSVSSPNGCDSPSMLSFLQHEKSCFGASKTAALLDPVTPNSMHETSMKSDTGSVKQWSAKKTPRIDYKKRTKRLWNNLEEVRHRRMLEEKKEQMERNRVKVKALTKKLSTKKKPM